MSRYRGKYSIPSMGTGEAGREAIARYLDFSLDLLNAPELSERARQLFAEPDNEVYLSSVSAWEIAIKHALGRLPLPEPPERFLPAQRRAHGIEPLPLDEQSTFQLSRLPALHNDPFDRMLICQAIVAGMTILSSDELVSQYPVRVVW